jgi:hypothetical protein
MKKIIHNVILNLLLLVGLVFSNTDQIISSVKRELEKPEKQIDVGYLSLLLSMDAFPEVDIKRTLLIFDAMAKNVRIICESSKDKMDLADKCIASLNTFLYRPGSWNTFGPKDHMVFSYDLNSDDDMQPKALFLPSMLQTKQGTCSTMPTLWYIIADRLGWPVNAVRGPGHIWVKYRGVIQDNIEATSNGGFFPDSQYIRDMQVSKIALQNGIYFKLLSKKQFISTLLVNNSYYCVQAVSDTVSAINICNYQYY